MFVHVLCVALCTVLCCMQAPVAQHMPSITLVFYISIPGDLSIWVPWFILLPATSQ